MFVIKQMSPVINGQFKGGLNPKDDFDIPVNISCLKTLQTALWKLYYSFFKK